MTNDGNNIKHYTGDDIARYWQGKLSKQEMHAMESAAMDDPFLADALEGYAGMPQDTIAADVTELRARLNERTGNTAAIIPFHRKKRWWAAAAAVIVLCGAGVLTYSLFRQSGTGALSQKENAESKPSGTVLQKSADSTAALSQNNSADTIAGTKDAVTLSGGTKAADSIVVVGNIARDQQSDNKTAAPLQAAAKPKQDNYAKPDVTSGEAETRKWAGAVRKDTAAIVSTDAPRNLAKALEGKAAGLQTDNNRLAPPTQADQENILRKENANRDAAINNFQGRVVDSRNAPIPNATVRRMYNNSEAIATDKYGNFQMKSPDSVMDLSVSSAGYESRQLTMRSNQPQNVMLDDASARLQEVVVTGTASRKKSERSSSSTLKVYVMDAQPVVTWDEYNRYIETSKRIDSAARSVQGEVVVLFTVGKTGKLSNFSIEKSLGKQQDAEAIRLIKEGPAWKVLKNKKAKARVIIPF